MSGLLPMRFVTKQGSI